MARSSSNKRLGKLAWLQPAILVGTLLPLPLLIWRATSGRLGANPIASSMNQLGLLTLIVLLASLACTPLKIIFGWKWPLRLRKTLGLAAFGYAVCHFLVYLILDQQLALAMVVEDILKRPFIAVGAAALALLIPLALTSSKRALQRLGPKRWQQLHRWVYLAAGLGVVHYFMRVKQETREPLIYAGVLGGLLVVRVVRWVKKVL